MPRTLAYMLVLIAVAAAVHAAPVEGYLPQFSRAVAPATRAEIPLSVSFPEGSTLRSHPVTFGVPFPRGALKSAENVRLLEDGNPIEASIRRTATWERPDGDVKWLLVDVTIQQGKTYSLEYGTEVRGVALIDAMTLTDNAEGVTLSTGPMQVSVSRARSALVNSVALDLNGDGEFTPDEVVSSPDGSAVPSMLDDQLRAYSVRPDADYRVSVEQPGPLHAIIRVDGWFTAEDGTKLCGHTARLHAYRGQSFIRIEHTFVVGYDTEQTRLRDIALPIPLTLGDGARAVFGLDNGAASEPLATGYLVQDAVDHFSLYGADGAVVNDGARAAGWLDCSTGGRGVTVGIRHMGQEYPRELEVTDEGLVAHLWPRHSDRPLDFDARAVLGPDLYTQWDKVYWQDWYKNGLDQYDQAYGLAKSNDLIIAFHAGNEPQAELCRTLDEPVIVAASPEWMCRSDVMGLLHPRDPATFPQEEKKMDLGFDRFEWLRQHLGDYGLIDYGDVHYNLAFDAEQGTWVAQPWRRFASRFYGHPVMPWVQFLTSGRREHLQWGIDNTRHVMDIDMAHLDNDALKKRRGGRYGGDGGILHYAGGMYDIGCDSHVDQLLLCYYLTGYRRAWDVLGEEADYCTWLDTRPGGAMHNWMHRMTGGALRTMIALYNATWEQKYLTVAERLAQICYENQDDQGVIRHDDVYMAPGLFTYYQATGDERMKELFLRCMAAQAKQGRNESDPRSFGLYGLSMAYFMTGDPSYLRWAERWRRDFLDKVQDVEDPLWRGQPKGEWDYSYLTLHLLYMPYYLDALSTLTEPVPPASKDSAITSGSVLLNRTDRKPFSAVAEWFCYDPEFCIGVTLNSFRRYIARHPTAARIVVRGPDGAEVISRPISITEGQTRGKMLIELPQGPVGLYRLGIEDAGGLHFKLRLSATEPTQWGYPTQDVYLACADAYYFHVPADCTRFTVGIKSLALRQPVKFSVYDSEGAAQMEKEITFTCEPQTDYLNYTSFPKPEQRGKLWRIAISPPNPSVEQTYLRFEGVPPIVWTSPDAFFTPTDAALATHPAPQPPTEPYTGAGANLPFLADWGIALSRAAVGEHYGHLQAQQGTLEFWIRPEWALDDIADATLVQCGPLRLYRRSRVGTYLGLGGTNQSGFVLEPGHWYHVALTWDAGAEGREPETQLFIDGVKTGAMLSQAREPLGDWTDERLEIGGRVAFTLDDLRISSTIRYSDDFDPPRALEEDAETLYLKQRWGTPEANQ